MVMKRYGWSWSDERTVERRKEPRFSVNMPVTVTVLGTTRQPPIAGQVEDMSGCGLRFRVRIPIDSGTLVKVEGNDILMLGEVRRTLITLDGYQVVMEVSHALAQLSDLERFHRAAV